MVNELERPRRPSSEDPLLECPDLRALESADEVTRAHVAGCTSCQVVVDLLAERRHGLEQRGRRAECDRFEMLLAARDEGTIGGTAGALLEGHLRECPDCRAVAATIPPPAVDGKATSLPAVSTAAYALGREVARGGMARIIAAEDLRIGRPVAVKEPLGRSEALAARFEREAHVTARLQHPGIVPIYEIGKWPDGTPFYAMRMVEGRTLREAIRDSASLDARLSLLPAVIAAADAVAFAHTKQIIHRDLTPNNILVGAHGDTVVIDWGLAKDLSIGDEEPFGSPYRDEAAPSSTLTSAGAVIGTASYMPPEQARGTAVDMRADVYALGAILYHLLSGNPPYRASASHEIVQQVQAGPPRPIAEAAPSAPRDLVSIVMKAMAREAGARYANAAVFAQELRRFQSGLIVEAHAYTIRERARRWTLRHRALLIALVATAITASFAGTLGLLGVLRERDAAEAGQREAEKQRALADKQRSLADKSTITLLDELGRQELLAGHPGRALALLSAAYSKGDSTVALRFLIRSAMQNFDGVEHVLAGTPDHVFGTTFSPDGSRLLSVHQAVIEQWRVRDGVLEARYPVLNFEQGAVEYSADGARLVSYYPRGRAFEPLKIWDTTRGTLVRAIDDRDAAFAGLSADGAHLIVLARDGVVRVRNVQDGRIETSMRAGTSGTVSGRLTRDGQHLVIVAGSNQVEVWDWQRHARVATLDHGARLSQWPDWTVAPDAGHIVTCGGGAGTKLWDGRSGRLLATIPPVSVGEVIFCRYIDERTLVTTTDDGYLSITDPVNRRVRSTLKLSDGPLIGGPLSDNARLVVTTLGDVDRHRVYDLKTGTILATYDGTQAGEPSRTPVGDRIALIARDQTIQIIDPSVGRLKSRFVLDDHAKERPLTVSSDKRRMITQSSGTLKLWDLTTGVQLPTPTLVPPSAMSRDGSRVVARTQDGATVVIDAATGNVLSTLTTTRSASSFALDEHGRRLAVVSPDQPTQVWDVERQKLVKSVPGLAVKSPIALMDGAGRRLVTMQQLGDAQLQDLEGDATPIGLTRDAISLVGFVADGKRLALVAEQPMGPNLKSSVILFDTASGAQVFEQEGLVAAFDHTGSRIVSATMGEMRVGNTASPDTHVSISTGASFRMIAVALTSDGSLVFSAGGVWSADDGQALAIFRPPSERSNVIEPLNDRSGGYDLGSVDVSRDGRSAVTYTMNEDVSVWDLSLEDRTPEEIAKFVSSHVPWRVENGHLVRVPPPTARLHGRITHKGVPVIAEVRIANTNHVRLSNAKGEYGFESLPVGSVKVWSVTSPERSAFTKPRSMVLKPDENELDLELEFAGSIAGQVLDGKGQAVGGVVVHADCPGCSDPDDGEADTDPTGHFVIGALSGGGTYALTVARKTAQARLRAPAEVVVKNGDDHVTGIRIELAP